MRAAGRQHWPPLQDSHTGHRRSSNLALPPCVLFLCRRRGRGALGAGVGAAQVGAAGPLVQLPQVRGHGAALLVRWAGLAGFRERGSSDRSEVMCYGTSLRCAGLAGFGEGWACALRGEGCPATNSPVARTAPQLLCNTRLHGLAGTRCLPKQRSLHKDLLCTPFPFPPQATRGCALWAAWTMRCSAASGAATGPAAWAAATEQPTPRTPA